MSHSFTVPERYSEHALQAFFAANPHACYGLDTQTWQTTQPRPSTPVVTIVTEHPNMHIVEGVMVALAAQTQVYSVSLHPLSAVLPQTGLCLSVAHLPDAELVAQIAQQFHVEVFAQQQQPVLSLPGVLVMDMDSTVIQIECIDEIAKLCGKGEEVSAVTELAMQGKLDFAESLLQRVACLEGIDVTTLAQIRDSIPLMPGIQTLLRHLKAQGWICAIASGGFTYFAEYLQARLGLDVVVANELEQRNGLLTGNIVGAISDAQTKADTLLRLVKTHDIAPEQTIALGDGANDLVMMAHAQLGMAYHAKPLVQAKATAAIRFGGLDNTLFALQG